MEGGSGERNGVCKQVEEKITAIEHNLLELVIQLDTALSDELLIPSWLMTLVNYKVWFAEITMCLARL
jgi:hypothetical protein